MLFSCVTALSIPLGFFSLIHSFIHSLAHSLTCVNGNGTMEEEAMVVGVSSLCSTYPNKASKSKCTKGKAQQQQQTSRSILSYPARQTKLPSESTNQQRRKKKDHDNDDLSITIIQQNKTNRGNRGQRGEERKEGGSSMLSSLVPSGSSHWKGITWHSTDKIGASILVCKEKKEKKEKKGTRQTTSMLTHVALPRFPCSLS